MKKNLLILSLAFLSLPIFAQTVDTEMLYRRAETMPLFKTCDVTDFNGSEYQCSMQQLTEQVSNSIQVENPVGGITKALVSLVVAKDGSISEVTLEREPVFRDSNDPELLAYVNNAILNAFKDLSFASSGMQGGEAVRVKLQFSQPIRY